MWEVYWKSHSLQQKASQTSHQTTSCHVLFISYFRCMWIFPSCNVTTINWGLYCQGLGILYAQFTLSWNFNFTRSDSWSVPGLPHLFENSKTCHSCVISFCLVLPSLRTQWCEYFLLEFRNLSNLFPLTNLDIFFPSNTGSILSTQQYQNNNG